MRPGEFWHLCSCGTSQRLPEAFSTAFECQPLLVRHIRVQNLDHAVPSDHAGKRKSNSKFLMEAADRDRRPLVADDDLRDPRRYDADAILARVIAFDDGDIGVADVLLEVGAKFSKISAGRLDELLHRYPRDACAPPQEYLCG